MARFACLLFLQMALLPLTLCSQRFSAGAVLGINASQIDGDDQFGYRQFGIVGGLQGIAQLSNRLDFKLELLYSQRGARAGANEKEKADYFANVRLQYVETPFLLDYKLLENWDGHYFLHLQSGVQYARLLESKVKEGFKKPSSEEAFTISAQQDNFQRNELSWVVGFSFYPFPKVHISLRHVLGLTPLLQRQEPDIRQLRSYYLQLRVGYRL